MLVESVEMVSVAVRLNKPVVVGVAYLLSESRRFTNYRTLTPPHFQERILRFILSSVAKTQDSMARKNIVGAQNTQICCRHFAK